MARQRKSNDSISICPVSAQSERLGISRTKVAYWRNKLEKVTSKRGNASPDYSVRIVHQNKRVRFPLKTSNKDAAASKAAQIFGFLLKNGWDETIAEFKPESKPKPEPKSDEICKPDTVGAFIAAASRHSTARAQSVEEYGKAMRRIVSGVLGFDGDDHTKRKYGGNVEWRQAVEGVKLSTLTPTKIQSWRNDFIKNAGHSETKRRKATTTTNSLIRNAKALFSRKILPFVSEEIDLPTPLPFEGVFLAKQPSSRYRSKIDGRELLKTGTEELKDSQPETYKMFLLALMCGLRVSEIDYLLWEAFDFKARLLRIESTDYHQLKSEDSAGEIDLADWVVEHFRNQLSLASGEFVIESTRPPGKRSNSRAYRCEPHINSLKKWLRSQGVTAQKPIHEMRKEIGSIIANSEGIFAASRYLRHADIRITSATYADKKKRVVADF